MSRGGCPRCGKTIPFAKAMFGRGRPFDCSDCGSRLCVPKTATGLALAAFILISILSEQIPFVAVAVLILVAILMEWLLAKVQLAEAPVS